VSASLEPATQGLRGEGAGTAPVTSETSHAAAPADPPAHRVLLVDDEENILASLRRLLRREPYELVTAGTASEALNLLEEQPAEVVISDQRMPGMTGIDLLREVRRRWPDTLRIILSGYSEVNTIIAAVNEGEIYKFLTKPWNDEELKLHIRRAIEQYDLAAENRRMAQEILAQNEKLRELNALLDQRAADASTGLSCTQNVLDAIDAKVLIVDDDGLVVGVYGRAAGLLRNQEGGITGMPVEAVLPPQLCEALRNVDPAEPRKASGVLEINGQRAQWRVSPVVGDGLQRGRVVTIWQEVR